MLAVFARKFLSCPFGPSTARTCNYEHGTKPKENRPLKVVCDVNTLVTLLLKVYQMTTLALPQNKLLTPERNPRQESPRFFVG
jgi:hypothetical protein